MVKQRNASKKVAIAKAVAKGTSLAAGISVAAIVLLALGLKIFDVPDEYITIINQVLKAASIVLGTLFGVGAGGESGYLKGAFIGGSYMAVGMGASMLATMQAMTPIAIVSDLALGGAVGAVSGALTANMKPKIAKAKDKPKAFAKN